MSLEKKIMDGMKTAMKAHDESTLRGLRAIKSAILMLKTSPDFKGEIAEDDEIKMLQKLVKQRKDSYDIYHQQGREDLAAKEKEEIDIIESFLPKQLTEEEIKAEITKIVQSAGASSMADMGKVMGIATKQLAGKADGKTISTMVRNMLSGGGH